jgi:hypothetical protein
MRPARQSPAGQAQTEYLIVLAFAVMVLVLSTAGPAPVQALIDGLKTAFAAFAYAISLSV